MRTNSSGSTTAPAGFEGELTRTMRVRLLRSGSILAAVTLNPPASSGGTNTHLPPAKFTTSLKVTQ